MPDADYTPAQRLLVFANVLVKATMLSLAIMCSGCGGGSMQADAEAYARLEKQAEESMAKADRYLASGNQKGQMAETMNTLMPLQSQMMEIASKYKSNEDEFMEAVKAVRSAE